MSYRIVFMGTPDFAVPSLAALLQSEHTVVAVVTQPDRPKGRGKKLAPPPVKILAEKHNIPVLQPEKIKTESFENSLRQFQADIFVVAAYGRILPPSLLTLPPLGCINVHGSLLPAHRGAAPIQWAVINGDEKAGVTIMQMDEGMDTGDMLLKAEVTVSPDETAGSLFTSLAELGASTLLTALTKMEKGTLVPEPQDPKAATKAPPLKKEMGNINWAMSARHLHCLIRGLDPWPCGFTFLDSKRCRIFSPEVVHQQSEYPAGTILLADASGLLIATGEECLLIKEIQPEGKKRMPVESFLRGHVIFPGTVFSNT